MAQHKSFDELRQELRATLAEAHRLRAEVAAARACLRATLQESRRILAELQTRRAEGRPADEPLQLDVPPGPVIHRD